MYGSRELSFNMNKSLLLKKISKPIGKKEASILAGFAESRPANINQAI